jgi:toxin ParE1/3/4
MTRRVVFSPRAELHLEELYRYILSDAGPMRADRVVGRLVHACESLADLPFRGTLRDDLLPGLRVMGYRRQATIAFTIEAETVTVHGVLWRGRNLDAVFDKKEAGGT